MFCPKCGTQNPDTSRFCRGCGTDLSNVSNALSGELGQPQSPVLFDHKGKPVSLERAIIKIFSGLAFIGLAIALAASPSGVGWWIWLFIPGFSALGHGIAQMVQLKRYEQQNMLISPQVVQNQIPMSLKSNLSPSQNDYIKPQKSIYDTDELVTVRGSVTEGTTRHLEINKEGEEITLPYKN